MIKHEVASHRGPEPQVLAPEQHVPQAAFPERQVGVLRPALHERIEDRCGHLRLDLRCRDLGMEGLK